MSQIRKIVAKVLKESNFSLNEKLEIQPDMFGGKNTYYKNGKQAVAFDDVFEFMKKIAPDLDYVEDRSTNDLYWMIYEPATPGLSKIDSKRVIDLESKLAKRFGEGVVKVKLANTQYAPEIEKIYIGFIDKADVEDNGMEEATEENINDHYFSNSPKLVFTSEQVEQDKLKQEFHNFAFVPSWFYDQASEEEQDNVGFADSSANTDFVFIGSQLNQNGDLILGIVKNSDFEGFVNKHYIYRRDKYYDTSSRKYYSEEQLKTKFYRIIDREYKKAVEELKYLHRIYGGKFIDVNSKNKDLEEGWKDNLKKGVATLGVAGALAGNAMAHDPMYDGAQRPFDNPNMTVELAQYLADQDEKATHLSDGTVIDQYGNKWTKEDWEMFMNGIDPNEDNDYPPEKMNETIEDPAVDEVRKRLANEFVDLEVTGPTYDKYDPDEPRAGKTQYYIKVPEEFYEARDLERMLQEIDSKYPEFEYEGEDFSNRVWFVINKKPEE